MQLTYDVLQSTSAKTIVVHKLKLETFQAIPGFYCASLCLQSHMSTLQGKMAFGFHFVSRSQMPGLDSAPSENESNWTLNYLAFMVGFWFLEGKS